jgi:uncharacterized damage-inducible protein DinB
MRELDRIADQLRRAYDGDAWYGPSVRAALDGVDARLATIRPLSGGHTICELVLHMTSWTREVTRRLRIGTAGDPEAGDWPVATVATDEEWDAVVVGLDEANADLLQTIATLDDAVLNARIGDVRDRALGSGVSRYITLHGIVQHHIYHTGQISLLKKAVATSTLS